MPDQLATVRPNSVVSAGVWTNVGGAASINAALADNNAATYAMDNTGASELRLGVAAAGLSAATLVKAVKARFSLDGTTGTAISFRVGLIWVPTGALVADSGPLSLVGVPTPTADYSAIAYQRPDGQPFTATDVDTNLQLSVQYLSGLSSTMKVYESYMEVQYNNAPIVIASSPADGATITSSTQPTLGWTYADPSGDPQERYRLKVFSGTGAVSDPETETARLVWDSGETVSSAASAQVGRALDNGGYSWYIKGADVGTNGRYSLWSGRTFTIAITAPPTPTLAVSVSLNPLVILTVTPTAGSPAADYFGFERSYDSGSTWEAFRPSQTVAASGSSAVALIDGGTRRGVAVQFRARGYRLVGGSPSPPSAASNVVTATLAPDGSSYFFTATGGSGGLGFFQAVKALIGSSPGWASESVEDQAEYDPAGRANYVVVAGAIRGERGEISLLYNDDNAYRFFETNIRGRQEPVLFKTCYGDTTIGGNGMEELWVRLGPVRSTTRYTTSDMRTNQRRRVTIGFRVVATPN